LKKVSQKNILSRENIQHKPEDLDSAKVHIVIPTNTESVISENTESAIHVNIESVIPMNTESVIPMNIESVISVNIEAVISIDTESVIPVNIGSVNSIDTESVIRINTESVILGDTSVSEIAPDTIKSKDLPEQGCNDNLKVSLTEWCYRALVSCTTEESKSKMERAVIATIEEANRSGYISKINWNIEPLPLLKPVKLSSCNTDHARSRFNNRKPHKHKKKRYYNKKK